MPDLDEEVQDLYEDLHTAFKKVPTRDWASERLEDTGSLTVDERGYLARKCHEARGALADALNLMNRMKDTGEGA